MDKWRKREERERERERENGFEVGHGRESVREKKERWMDWTDGLDRWIV